MSIDIYRYSKSFTPKQRPAKKPLLGKFEEKEKLTNEFLAALPKHKSPTVTLISATTTGAMLKPMKVKGTKPGKNTARTDVNVLARATEYYGNGKRIAIVKNDGFGKFEEHFYKDKIAITLPELNSLVAFKPTLDRCIKRAKANLDKCTILRAYPIKIINGNMIEYIKSLKPMRLVYKLECRATAGDTILSCTNRLLRQILLFKGIGFAQVEQDVRENKMRPVTYVVNTTINYNITGDSRFGRALHCHRITVKKTFRETINNGGRLEQNCNIFFDSHSCKAITLWLESLKDDFIETI